MSRSIPWGNSIFAQPHVCSRATAVHYAVHHRMSSPSVPSKMQSNLEPFRCRQIGCRIVCAAAGTGLPVELESIVTSFQAVPDPMQVSYRIHHLWNKLIVTFWWLDALVSWLGLAVISLWVMSFFSWISRVCFFICMQRYKQLLFYATKLQELPKDYKVEQNKVKGCVSQVWVVPSLQEDGTIVWRADSDSQLTKVCACMPLVPSLSIWYISWYI